MKTKLDEFVDWLIKEYQTKTIDLITYHPEEISEMLYDSLKETVLSKMKPKEINTIEDLAKLLNGNNYGEELKNPYNINVEELCKKNKWVVLFPYSDDNLEARGYIDDEISAYDGVDAIIYKKGDFYPEDLDEETFKRASQNMIHGISDSLIFDAEVEDGHIGIKAQWDSADKPYTWYLDVKSDKKYIDNKPIVAYFDLVDEDDEEDHTWARCCIIDCSEI